MARRFRFNSKTPADAGKEEARSSFINAFLPIFELVLL